MIKDFDVPFPPWANLRIWLCPLSDPKLATAVPSIRLWQDNVQRKRAEFSLLCQLARKIVLRHPVADHFLVAIAMDRLMYTPYKWLIKGVRSHTIGSEQPNSLLGKSSTSKGPRPHRDGDTFDKKARREGQNGYWKTTNNCCQNLTGLKTHITCPHTSFHWLRK